MAHTVSSKRKEPVQQVKPEPVQKSHSDWRCFFTSCSKPGCFGFGVRLRNGMESRWACMEHRDAVRAPGFECAA